MPGQDWSWADCRLFAATAAVPMAAVTPSRSRPARTRRCICTIMPSAGAPYTALTFWINGGATPGSRSSSGAGDAERNRASLALSIPAPPASIAGTLVTIDHGAASASPARSTLDGFWIQGHQRQSASTDAVLCGRYCSDRGTAVSNGPVTVSVDAAANKPCDQPADLRCSLRRYDCLWPT